METVSYTGYNVEKGLVPLFEAPSEWFEPIMEQYEMACGKFGKIISLSPEAVTFRAWGKEPANSTWHQEMEEFFNTDGITNKTVSGNSAPSDVTVLNSEEQAQELTTPATWATFDGRHVYMYERVPFESPPITSTEQLGTEFEQILHTDVVSLDKLCESAAEVMESRS